MMEVVGYIRFGMVKTAIVIQTSMIMALEIKPRLGHGIGNTEAGC